MKQVEAWKCDYCSRVSRTKTGMMRHEAACKNNPEKRFCVTCIHGCIGVVGQEPFLYDRDFSVDVHAPFCDYHNKPIFEKPYDRNMYTSRNK